MILFDAFYASLLLKRKIEKLQVLTFDHGRQPIRRLNERSQDSNENSRLIRDQIEDSSDESTRKPSVKRIVQHSIENQEVKHQSNSNVIDKIFSKDYSKLFQNDSSDTHKQNPSEGVRPESTNHQNDSSFFIHRNSETDSGRNLQNIFATESKLNINNGHADGDSNNSDPVNDNDIKNQQEVSYIRTFEENLTI